MTDFGEKYAAELESELRASVPEGGDAAGLYDMLRYHLGWLEDEDASSRASGGKRIRPTLCLMACEAYGGDYRPALPAAAAVELLHNFTLIHDDIQDRSAERRHRSTVWKLWGEAQAINAGDVMNSLARLALLRMAGRGVGADVILQALNMLDRTCARICEGQYLDLQFENRLDIDRETYLGMIERKTAALVGCALEMGTLVGGASAEQVDLMRGLGDTLGLAYQVQDDILGIWGEPRVTGKPAADDIRRRKKTLPVVHALECASGEQKTRLAQLLGQPRVDDNEVDEVL
ncbi:MAG: polyprenyl synthetase family protein, partial [Chloroflexota bacterium]